MCTYIVGVYILRLVTELVEIYGMLKCRRNHVLEAEIKWSTSWGIYAFCVFKWDQATNIYIIF